MELSISFIYCKEIVINVLKHVLCKDIFRICKLWTEALLQYKWLYTELVANMRPQDIPAMFWDILSFEQRISIPNYFCVAETFTAAYLRPEFNISWASIIGYCAETHDRAAWLLNITKENKRREPSNTVDYVHNMFTLYEQFRRYIIGVLKSIHGITIDLKEVEQSTLNDRGLIVIVDTILFENLPLPLVESLCIERFYLWRALSFLQ